MDNATTEGSPPVAGVEWLNLLKAAQRLGYATRKPIEGAIERGELEAYDCPGGRGRRVRSVDLDRYAESLRYSPQVQVETTAPQRRRRRETKPLRYSTTKKEA